MPKHIADELQVVSLQGLLSLHGLTHLHARGHGALLVIESGAKDKRVPHARLRRVGVHLWWLELPTHTGRWERTGFRGQIAPLLAVLENDFPWLLTPIA